MKIGQTESIKIDEHKRNDFLELLKEYNPKYVEHIVPKEMINMHEEKKTKAK